VTDMGIMTGMRTGTRTDMHILILILIPNWRSWRFFIPISIPIQYRDILSKWERVRTIPGGRVYLSSLVASCTIVPWQRLGEPSHNSVVVFLVE